MRGHFTLRYILYFLYYYIWTNDIKNVYLRDVVVALQVSSIEYHE